MLNVKIHWYNKVVSLFLEQKNCLSFKVKILWEDQKFLKISPTFFWQNNCFHSEASKQVNNFFKVLWPNQKSWTLPDCQRKPSEKMFFCWGCQLRLRRIEVVLAEKRKSFEIAQVAWSLLKQFRRPRLSGPLRPPAARRTRHRSCRRWRQCRQPRRPPPSCPWPH